MVSILLELWVGILWQNPGLGSRSSEHLVKNCKDTGVILAIRVRLHSERWRKDEDSMISAVIERPALLNPGNDLLEKDSGIVNELVSSEESSASDGVC